MSKYKNPSFVREAMDSHDEASNKLNKTDSGNVIDEAELDLIDGDEPTEAKQLENELAKVTVSSTSFSSDPSTVFDAADYPESYRQNNKKEKRVLAYAENFRKQYVHLYRDRKPLLLNPLNELQVEKFVCTTIRPTELPYKELYEWQGAAEFVSDYLNLALLNPAYELPTRLLSPNTVVKLQRGNCFEYSTLLAQLNHDEMRDGKLTRQQALKLKDDCLNYLKQQLVDKANLIQSRFEKETRELKKKQAWYQQNQVSMLKADEQQYLSYCNETLFRIHILELRLNRHKEVAPRIFHSMEQTLRSDPRLMEFL